jgi:hypothetical protein
MFSVTDPHGRNLGFIDLSHYYFFQAAPQLYSRGWVDSVPNPLLHRKSGSAGNRTRTSGSVASNSDHQTTEAVNPLGIQSRIYSGVNEYITAMPAFLDLTLSSLVEVHRHFGGTYCIHIQSRNLKEAKVIPVTDCGAPYYCRTQGSHIF